MRTLTWVRFLRLHTYNNSLFEPWLSNRWLRPSMLGSSLHMPILAKCQLGNVPLGRTLRAVRPSKDELCVLTQVTQATELLNPQQFNPPQFNPLLYERRQQILMRRRLAMFAPSRHPLLLRLRDKASGAHWALNEA